MQPRRVEARPARLSEEPQFFQCGNCGNLIIQENMNKPQINLQCCGKEMEVLIPNTYPDLADEHLPIITFTGGFERNAANIKIGKEPHPMIEEHHIEWIYLRTSEGGQFKRMKLNINPEANFSMADDDAYAYCNRPICYMGRRHCNFQCKRYFTAFIYCNQHGLWKTKM